MTSCSSYSISFHDFYSYLFCSSMEKSRPVISFDNTEYAFAYKSNAALRKAKFLFSTMGYPWLVKLGTRITPWAIHMRLPVNGMIRITIFSQFVGGETLEQTSKVAD